MEMPAILLVTAVVIFTLTAAVTDLKTRRIPNWLNVSAFVAALVVHTALGGLAGLGSAALGFCVGFGILLGLWLIGGGGGGDVKLMGALGAWLGVSLTLQVFFLSVLVTCILAGGVLMVTFIGHGFRKTQQRYLATGESSQRRSRRTEAEKKKRAFKRRLMPYAVPVALSTWVVLAAAWNASSLPL